jgi:hypothetical protein
VRRKTRKAVLRLERGARAARRAAGNLILDHGDALAALSVAIGALMLAILPA